MTIAAAIPDPSSLVAGLTQHDYLAESGLATFRGADGLWDGHPVERVASPGGFVADPELVWRFYSMRRADAAAAQPNAAHHALVRLEERLGDSALVSLGDVTDSEPASLIMMKSEAGWRIRDYLER